MSKPPGPTPPPRPLNRVEEINLLHSQIESAVRITVEKIVRLGRLLTEVKSGLPHGHWLPWLAANVHFCDRTARRYMRAWDKDRIGQGVRFESEVDRLQRLMDNAPPPTVDQGHPLINAVIEVGKMSVPKARLIRSHWAPKGAARRCCVYTSRGRLGPDEILDALHRQNLFLGLDTEDDLLDALDAAGRVKVEEPTCPVEDLLDALKNARNAIARMRDDGELFKIDYPAAMECLTQLENIIKP